MGLTVEVRRVRPVSELLTWHWPLGEVDLKLLDWAWLWKEFTQSGNYDLFLRGYNMFAVAMEVSDRQWVMKSELATVNYFLRHEIGGADITPEDLGRLTWKHEQAHKEAAARWGFCLKTGLPG